MQDWVIAVIADYGYWGVFFMIALENLFPPIPSEIILTFGGFMVTVTSMNTFGVISAATAGSLVGALLLYILGRQLGNARVNHLVGSWGKPLHMKQNDLDRALQWFDRYKGKTVFFCRMVPLARSLISIPAGIARMPAGRFLFLSGLGAAIWNTVLVAAGVLLGEQWESVVSFFRLYSRGTCVVLGVGAVAVGAILLFHRRNRE